MLAGEDEFLDSSPLTKRELYNLGLEHGRENFKEKIKDCLITSLTLDEVEDMFDSVYGGSVTKEEAFDSFKVFTRKIKLNDVEQKDGE